MKDDRLRVPMDQAYLTSLGTATYCFATLEWNAVYCGEKLNPGYASQVSAKTAGTIGRNLKNFAILVTDRGKRVRYEQAILEFQHLVLRRNDLFHANPATIGNDQRLVRKGTPWRPNDIDDIADEFAACSMKLYELFHHVL